MTADNCGLDGCVFTATDDGELDRVLEAAEPGDMVRLGGETGSRIATGAVRGRGYPENFTRDRRITTEGLHFRGQLGSGPGSRINAEWTIEEQFRLEGLYLRGKYKVEQSEWNFNARGQIINCRSTQSRLNLNGSRILVTGLFNGPGYPSDITINGSDCVVTGGLLNTDVTDNGTRSVVEGWGRNHGNPIRGEGQWAGESTYARDMGAAILDGQGGDIFVPHPDSSGGWLQVKTDSGRDVQG